MTPAQFQLYELAYIRGGSPAARAEMAIDAAGRQVQRFSNVQLVPAKAIELCRTMKLCIAAYCRVDEAHLHISHQTMHASGGQANQVYGGAVLLLDERALAANPLVLAEARARAVEVAELLGAKSLKPHGFVQPDAQTAAAHPALTLSDLAGSPLLGAVMPQPIDVVVPGHPSLRLEGRLRRSNRRHFERNVKSVRGQLRTVAIGGRGHRFTVRGHDLSSMTKFGDEAVCFPESLRATVVAALATPGQRVLLSIAEEVLDEGRAEPRVKRVLENIWLEAAAPDATGSHQTKQACDASAS